MAAALRPLRLPGFPNLSAAYFVNEIGYWLGEIALAVLVFSQTNSPIATAALFCGMHFAPAFLGPPLLVRVETLPVKVALPLLYVVEAAAFAALALLANNFALALVLIIATIDGSAASASRALTRAAAAAVLVPEGKLREGNALLNVAFTIGSAGGPALGGLVVAGAGVQTALFADAISFLAAASILVVAPLRPLEPDDPGLGWGERLRRGIAYVRTRPALSRLLAAQGVAFIFFALVLPIEVVFAVETLGAGDTGYGFLLASWGVGMFIGSTLFAILRRVPLGVLLVLSTAAIGVAYLATSIAPTLAVACAASVLGGIGNGVQWIALVTAIQELTRSSYQARVLSMLEAIGSAMPGIGFLIGGALAAIFSPRLSYAVAGFGVLTVLGLAIALMRNTEWTPELEEGTDPEDTEPVAPEGSGAISVAQEGPSGSVLTSS